MKLGYVVPEFPSQTHAFFWREITALRQLGAEVSIVSTRCADMSAVKHAFALPAKEETFYLHPPKLSFIVYALCRLPWLLSALCYALRLQGRKAKLVTLYCAVLAAGLRQHAEQKKLTHIHGHSCANVAHILAMASLRGGPSYSLTLHGSLETYGDNHRQKFALARFVSTVTRPLQQDVMALMQWPADKVPVISMGVDTQKFPGLPREVDAEQPLQLISVARLALGKGHKFTLEALAECKKLGYVWRYAIVGSGPDEQAIKQTVQDLQLQDWVDFKGSMGEAGVIDALEKADVLMLTSQGTFEAAPVCVMEAMASAIPTITSIIGGTADMITNAEDGFLVPQGDVAAITQALKAFFERRELVVQLGEQARRRALVQFDYVALGEKLLRAIEA